MSINTLHEGDDDDDDADDDDAAADDNNNNNNNCITVYVKHFLCSIQLFVLRCCSFCCIFA